MLAPESPRGPRYNGLPMRAEERRHGTPESASASRRRIWAAGFIVVRWLSAVCNVPSLCGWLSATSWLLAALLAVELTRSPAGFRPLIPVRRGSRLLLLTCALNLVGGPVAAVMDENALHGSITGGLDLLAWGWVLCGAVAAGHWFWSPGHTAATAAPPRLAIRHVLVSVVVVAVLGLQAAALFKHRPTWWPFIDYPLYSSAHTAPVQTRHYRLHGVTREDPPALVEITADALGMSWFVYHTQLLPRLFDRPWAAHEDFRRTLVESRLPPFRAIMAEATWYLLEDGRLVKRADTRTLALDPPPGPAGREAAEASSTGAVR